MRKNIQIILDTIAGIDLLIAIIRPTGKVFIMALIAAGIARGYRHFNKKEEDNGQ